MPSTKNVRTVRTTVTGRKLLSIILNNYQKLNYFHSNVSRNITSKPNCNTWSAQLKLTNYYLIKSLEKLCVQLPRRGKRKCYNLWECCCVPVLFSQEYCPLLYCHCGSVIVQLIINTLLVEATNSDIVAIRFGVRHHNCVCVRCGCTVCEKHFFFPSSQNNTEYLSIPHFEIDYNYGFFYTQYMALLLRYI